MAITNTNTKTKTNTNTVQKGHIDVSIYTGNTYTFYHKFKGKITGIVSWKDETEPLISIIPTGKGGRAKSEEIYINMGLVKKYEQI